MRLEPQRQRPYLMLIRIQIVKITTISCLGCDAHIESPWSSEASSLCPDLSTVVIPSFRIWSPILQHWHVHPLLLDSGRAWCWCVNAPEALQHPLCLVGDGVDGGGLVADLVQAGLHGLDETLAGLVGPVLVDAVVDVDQYVLNVVSLLVQAVRVDTRDAGELEEVEQGRLGEALEVEGALAVGVARRVAILNGLEGLDAGFLEGGELVL